jgi:hypothetical protein
MRHTILFAAVMIGGCSRPESDPSNPEPPIDWGEQLDPDRDCVFEPGPGGALTIALPAADKELSIERGRTNAPRTARTVTGNFVATVRVRGTFKASTLAVAPDRPASVGAGLVVMGDDRTYVRFERVGLHKGGEDSTYLAWEARQDGKLARPSNPGEAKLVETDVWLRLIRRGPLVRAVYSQDGGETWNPLPELTVRMPDEVKVGVAAVTTGARAFKPTFDRFTIDPLP